MARFVSPITDMKPLGHLLFYKSKTNTELVTYKDELETIENTTQVAVNADGNVANVFFSGSAKVKYFDQFGVQYAERDPVGGSKELGNFSLWSADVIFDENDLVTGSNGSYYKSLVNDNQDNDPVLNAGSNASWEEVTFTGVWNSNITYDVGDISKTTTGNLWKAATATAGNDPEADDGTNWLPAIDGSKVVEVTTNTTRISTVLPQTVSGTLTAGGQTNEIRDSGAFTMPLANSVEANTILVVNLPDTFAAQTPSLTRGGTDLIRNNGGTDTVVDWVGAAKLTFTSNGTDEWSL